MHPFFSTLFSNSLQLHFGHPAACASRRASLTNPTHPPTTFPSLERSRRRRRRRRRRRNDNENIVLKLNFPLCWVPPLSLSFFPPFLLTWCWLSLSLLPLLFSSLLSPLFLFTEVARASAETPPFLFPLLSARRIFFLSPFLPAGGEKLSRIFEENKSTEKK